MATSKAVPIIVWDIDGTLLWGLHKHFKKEEEKSLWESRAGAILFRLLIILGHFWRLPNRNAKNCLAILSAAHEQYVISAREERYLKHLTDLQFRLLGFNRYLSSDRVLLQPGHIYNSQEWKIRKLRELTKETERPIVFIDNDPNIALHVARIAKHEKLSIQTLLYRGQLSSEIIRAQALTNLFMIKDLQEVLEFVLRAKAKQP